jgi:hypothetical protein
MILQDVKATADYGNFATGQRASTRPLLNYDKHASEQCRRKPICE